MKQQLFYYTQTIIGMAISHFIPTYLFWFWVCVSLYLGHKLNKINYNNKKQKIKAPEKIES